MEEAKVLVMSYYGYIFKNLGDGEYEIEKRVCEEIPQNQDPLDAVRQAIVVNCDNVRDIAETNKLFPCGEMVLPVSVGDDRGDYIQFNVLSGLKVNGKLYVDLDQCIKVL